MTVKLHELTPVTENVVHETCDQLPKCQTCLARLRPELSQGPPGRAGDAVRTGGSG